jgi:hypothetical protein
VTAGPDESRNDAPLLGWSYAIFASVFAGGVALGWGLHVPPSRHELTVAATYMAIALVSARVAAAISNAHGRNQLFWAAALTAVIFSFLLWAPSLVYGAIFAPAAGRTSFLDLLIGSIFFFGWTLIVTLVLCFLGTLLFAGLRSVIGKLLPTQ